MRELFTTYLINKGFSYNYVNRIENVITWEKYDGWDDVAKYINKLCIEYSEYGSKAELGARHRNSVINALKKFKEFLEKRN